MKSEQAETSHTQKEEKIALRVAADQYQLTVLLPSLGSKDGTGFPSILSFFNENSFHEKLRPHC